MKVVVASPWIPREWITAYGHEPCGVWYHPRFGSTRGAVSAGVCPFAQRVALLAEAHNDSAFVFPTHCDQLRRAYDSIRAETRNRSFLFNLPATWQSTAARKILSAELMRLGDFLLQLGGRAPAPSTLARHLEEYRTARTELARAGRWCYGSTYAKALGQFHREGSFSLPTGSKPGDATSHRANKRPHLAILGGPLDIEEIDLIGKIEALGGEIVLNATETGERTLAPHGLEQLPQRVAGDSLELLAEELARGMLPQWADVFQRPNTPLYDWLARRLTERQVQGLVLWHQVGCDLWRAEAETLRETFRLPLLSIEAEESATTSPRTIGRIQAFLEALQ